MGQHAQSCHLLLRAQETTLSPNQDLSEQVIDAESKDERDDLVLAAQLLRIVCRKLELDAYMYLQKCVNSSFSVKAGGELKFVRELGQVLLTLRWRVSWWTLLGDGGAAPDAGKQRFEEHVNSLCRILYFYYCSMRRTKLPSFSSKDSLGGIWSNYADTSLSIYDDFPKVESIDGFEAWMKMGKDLIMKAGVAGKLAGIGLKAS